MLKKRIAPRRAKMGQTTLKLFRAGNGHSARMENARPGADVTTYSNNNVEYVTGRSGGVSTYDSVDPTLNGKWWELPTGIDYDDKTLFLKDDRNGHWEWQPEHDMPFDEYKAALALLNGKFTLVP